ncbi:helix-turn-helix transcriptional regulator [Bacillus sp. NPDC077411]|uniref:helix-turn-helix transcriptional regulator n=1 Tax=unclassified Bacillus (in: firmicutes) TaxID=185979 RepID=UPI0008EDF407|nr:MULTISPECIES: helix-turn-helix domain-containing protein [unclassified Bacillus (in: firmicutes)]SFI00998.1 DNA-binding transcriptional regulator, XRE-family HTH domain [Bacillus sp. 71mf]SFS92562.1 DNA-binding transcriptional regulator, XRE-family HTH domain [Bacillus sp. 103mf]
MNKDEVVLIIAKKMKLVRTEYNYTQEEMAEILGLSKKTLVQIEKERILPSWTTVVAICALFQSSEIVQSAFGGSALEVVQTIAHHQMEYKKEKTMGGHIWWKEIEKRGDFCLQQNIVSQHYRILDGENYRWFSTFHKEEAIEKLVRFSEQVK